MTRLMTLGYVVVVLENQTPMADWRRDWVALPLEDRYLDALALVHAAIGFSSTDLVRLMTWGEGFGGGLAVAAASLIPGVIRCATLDLLSDDLRTMCDGVVGTDRTVLDSLDSVGLAALLTCPLLLGTGLPDQTTPPRCQYTIFSWVRESKTHLVYPKCEHERINFLENELLEFSHT